MKVLLTYVSTVNGKITKGNNDNVGVWASDEDHKHYKLIEASSDVIVHSSSTYKVGKKSIDVDDERKHVVMTRTPEKYSGLPDHVEVTSETPEDLIDRLRGENSKLVLLSMGGKLVSQFLKSGLVDEFKLTIEPKLFGKGIPMVGDEEMFLDLNLKKVERLNEVGTLLLTYKFKK